MVSWFVCHLLFKNLELTCVCRSPKYNLPTEAAGRHTATGFEPRHSDSSIRVFLPSSCTALFRLSRQEPGRESTCDLLMFLFSVALLQEDERQIVAECPCLRDALYDYQISQRLTFKILKFMGQRWYDIIIEMRMLSIFLMKKTPSNCRKL